MRRWDGLVDGYIKECETRGLQGSTIKGMVYELERCGRWLKRCRPRIDLEQIDSVQFVEYFKTRTAFRARCTVYRSVGIVRGFGEYLSRQGVWLNNPVRWIKGPKMDPRMCLPRRIDSGVMKRLWDGVEQMTSDSKRSVLRCVLAILYGTGIRRGELERLNVKDWDREAGVLKIDGHKTGQERTVPVGPGVWRCLEAYWPHRQDRLDRNGRLEESALMINTEGHRLSGDAISLMIQRCARKAGLSRITLHQFRHSCASDLLDSGVTLPEVQKLLGHAVIETTMRYTHISCGERAIAIQKHPINDFLKPADSTEERKAVI